MEEAGSERILPTEPEQRGITQTSGFPSLLPPASDTWQLAAPLEARGTERFGSGEVSDKSMGCLLELRGEQWEVTELPSAPRWG